MKKPLIVIAALAAVVVVLAGAAFALSRDRTPDPVIATVDGIPIHESAATSRVEGINTVHADAEPSMGPEWRAMVLQSLVDDVIMNREAEELGLDPSDKEVAAELDSLRSRFSSSDEWKQFLEDSGMNEDEIERRILLQMIGARVYNAVTGDIVVTDDDLLAYYEDHEDDFTVNGEVRAFLEVRSSIEDEVSKTLKDAAYGDWLERTRKEVVVVVVSDDWK
ncbi:MAG: SurA N-terminal domain-containing protein [Actinomycetota bacterium]